MTLIFVYNANSGTLNMLFDMGHKLISPNTYQCSLCALTHDTFKENDTWKTFRNAYDDTMAFYHKDEFEAKFPETQISYPSILKLEHNKLTVLIDDIALETITSVEDLIIKLKTHL